MFSFRVERFFINKFYNLPFFSTVFYWVKRFFINRFSGFSPQFSLGLRGFSISHVFTGYFFTILITLPLCWMLFTSLIINPYLTELVFQKKGNCNIIKSGLSYGLVLGSGYNNIYAQIADIITSTLGYAWYKALAPCSYKVTFLISLSLDDSMLGITPNIIAFTQTRTY